MGTNGTKKWAEEGWKGRIASACGLAMARTEWTGQSMGTWNLLGADASKEQNVKGSEGS